MKLETLEITCFRQDKKKQRGKADFRLTTRKCLRQVCRYTINKKNLRGKPATEDIRHMVN